MSKLFNTTERGFKIFGEITDEAGSRLSLVESSAVGRPNLRLYAFYKYDRSDAPFSSCVTLDVENVKNLIESLKDFVEDTEEQDNWRNSDDYKISFG